MKRGGDGAHGLLEVFEPRQERDNVEQGGMGCSCTQMDKYLGPSAVSHTQ